MALQSSTKPEVVHLEKLQRNDFRSTYGCNKLLQSSDSFNPFVTPEDQSWRVGLVRELLEVRDGDVLVPGFSSVELQQILDLSCKE